jgi:hypothetical protein
LVQLLHQPLLISRVETVEGGIAAQHSLLVLDGKIAVLIEPVPQMPRRSGARIEINRAR